VRFVDEARIHVAAGAGGSGSTAFHHEPYKPKGGPDGGDGGDGGDVVLRADGSIGTLSELRDHPHVKAGRGGHGEGKRRHGARGKDRVVLVPPGTVVYDEQGVLLADLAAPGHELLVAKGGRGGRGNARFATPTRRAPTFSERGEPGEQRWIRLELRLLADVGLVGFPNSGKSTLVSRISKARPRVADYPFTTLVPNLGVVTGDESSFVVADIPGLVEGAHEGKGLGARFLRHVRRAAVLVFMIDLAAADRDPVDDIGVLRKELEGFDEELASRPSLIVANKVDVGRDVAAPVVERHPDAMLISAVTGEGIPELTGALERLVREIRSHAAPSGSGFIRHVVRDDPIRVVREPDGWRVSSRRVERAVAATDLDNDEAVSRLQRKLISMGVERLLEQAGAKRGDDVVIGDASFAFEPDDRDERATAEEGRGP
jgi:GTP-binding protein